MKIRYFALLKDHIKKSEEEFSESFSTPLEAFNFIKKKYNLPLEANQIRIAVNDEFANLESKISENDVLVFIPPVAGG